MPDLSSIFAGHARNDIIAGEKDVSAAVRAAATALSGGPCPETARLDAELLAAHLAGVSRTDLLLSPPAQLSASDYRVMIERRLAGEPVAHITGTAEFWSLPLEVNAAVLIPRPDTETLIELALELYPKRSPETILDLGTGSGALLLAALSEFRKADGLGLDASAEAIIVASRNAESLGFHDRAAFLIGTWQSLDRGPFDLILCNPPYIGDAEEVGPGVREFEPHAALFADKQGLAAYEAIFPRLRRLLAADGLAIFEVGAGQARQVEDLASAAGLVLAASRKDLGGHERALAFRLP